MSTSTNTRQSRGRACLSCHFRKKRCDGEQPTCGLCARSLLVCEYPPAPPAPERRPTGPSRIQALESRVRELEAVLNDMDIEASQPSSPSSPPRSSLIDPHSGEVVDWLQDILRPTLIINRRQYNLYLDTTTLKSPPRPLLHAMNLIACHIISLSANADTHPSLQELEELKRVLLKNVHNGIHMSLENAQDLVAGVVCAPALAAQYLLQAGKLAEAHWLSSTAIRFAVSCGLHTIVGHQWVGRDGGNSSSRGITSSEPVGTLLVPASNAREHHDRSMAWWLAFATDGMVEIVAKLPSALRPELRVCIGDVDSELGRIRRIITPFPLMEDAYEQGANQASPGLSISELFLGNDSEVQDPSMNSIFSMRLKSMAFVTVAGLLSDGANLFQRIDQSISRFIESLPSSAYHKSTHAAVSSENDDSVKSNMVLAHMLAYLAKIRLYSISPEFSQNRLHTALLVGRLASQLNIIPDANVATLITRCCSEALHIISPPGTAYDIQLPEAASLRLLLDLLVR
ncbi:GAL4-like Zn(II)2Cys6 (or C6 zinc) binuclear cluster DNA-binding domain, partial [Rhizoctonia solani]